MIGRSPYPDGGDGAFYRLHARSYDTRIGVHTFGLRSSVGGSNLAVTNPTASSELPDGTIGGLASHAFDGNTATAWMTNAQLLGWVQGQVSGDPAIAEYAVGADKNFPSTRSPLAFRLLKSTDGGLTWTVLDLRSGLTWLGDATELKTFTPAQTDAGVDVSESTGTSTTSTTGSSYSQIEVDLTIHEAFTLTAVTISSPVTGSRTLTVIQGGVTLGSGTASGSGMQKHTLSSPVSVAASPLTLRLNTASASTWPYINNVNYRGYYFVPSQMRFGANPNGTNTVPLTLHIAR